MVIDKRNIFSEIDLKPFTEKLINEYYNTIEGLCASAGKQAAKVCNLETEPTATEYATLCSKIVDEINTYIQMRKQRFVPYIHELIEKTENSHDCLNCSGNCKLNHDMQIVNLTASNDMAKSALSRLQLATLPLYSHTMYPDEYRILRNRMALIEMNITELFFLENNYLLPKVMEAQKVINAVHS